MRTDGLNAVLTLFINMKGRVDSPVLMITMAKRYLKSFFKGNESVISSDPPCKERNVCFRIVPLKPLTFYRVKIALCLNLLKTT